MALTMTTTTTTAASSATSATSSTTAITNPSRRPVVGGVAGRGFNNSSLDNNTNTSNHSNSYNNNNSSAGSLINMEYANIEEDSDEEFGKKEDESSEQQLNTSYYEDYGFDSYKNDKNDCNNNNNNQHDVDLERMIPMSTSNGSTSNITSQNYTSTSANRRIPTSKASPIIASTNTNTNSTNNSTARTGMGLRLRSGSNDELQFLMHHNTIPQQSGCNDSFPMASSSIRHNNDSNNINNHCNHSNNNSNNNSSSKNSSSNPIQPQAISASASAVEVAATTISRLFSFQRNGYLFSTNTSTNNTAANTAGGSVNVTSSCSNNSNHHYQQHQQQHQQQQLLQFKNSSSFMTVDSGTGIGGYGGNCPTSGGVSILKNLNKDVMGNSNKNHSNIMYKGNNGSSRIISSCTNLKVMNDNNTAPRTENLACTSNNTLPTISSTNSMKIPLSTATLIPTSNTSNSSGPSNSGSANVLAGGITMGNNNNSIAIFQLLFGTVGIFLTYLYYGNVQEDLFRYRDPVDGTTFTYVWFLQMAESSVTILLGYVGRQYTNRQFSPAKQLQQSQQTLPTFLFFQSGTCQLLGKALMAMSLAAGLSFPVVVLAKSAKVVPVMLGQCVLGGSKYSFRDYLFAVLIVAGTALLSFGSSSTTDTQHDKLVSSDRNTTLGLWLIFLSLVMDGVTGGLQKKLKRETSSMVVTTYDFLFYSHTAMFLVAMFISIVTGELWRGHVFLLRHLQQRRQQHLVPSSSSIGAPSTNVLYLLVASCMCSAVGQCFIFYVIATFDPLVCTTITTTRKMASVLYSIMFKGHRLVYQGVFGLILGISALFLEIEQQISKNNKKQHNNTINSNSSKKHHHLQQQPLLQETR